MTGAIWALAYDISAIDRYQYLDWFHRVHIPDKLARPGYRWAAHYQGAATTPDMDSYIALFGGATTRVFLHPSPAQLKTKQDNLTRKMMTLRHNPYAAILTHEWSVSTPPATADQMNSIDPMTADRLDFLGIDAGGGSGMDEAVGAWAVQQLMPRLHHDRASDGQITAVTHKLVSVTGGPLHIVMHLRDGTKTPDDNLFDPDGSIMADRPETAALKHRSGTLIWPSLIAQPLPRI
ncbi:MAG: hypothetical protein O2835_06035 [Proteobacteria bacterium]|nr:hypothetical protein [Pseudomonadota bacterium]MDA0960445.1 hypothetical protein [Pseudomonadota bacterium]MDA1152009.1 hypothetical protein [Pseudomonadota bacterium]